MKSIALKLTKDMVTIWDKIKNIIVVSLTVKISQMKIIMIITEVRM